MGGASSAGAAGAASSAGAAGATSAASSAATNAAASGATQNLTQQYMQKYGYNPYQMAGQYITSGIDGIGKAVANQKTGYSPEMNAPVFSRQNYSFNIPSSPSAGGIFSGTNFSNAARRNIGI